MITMDNRQFSIGAFLQKWGVLVGLILLMAFFSFKSQHFLTVDNLLNVARQTSITAIIAVGMTMVIIICGIDLSVGSVVGLSTVMMGVFITKWGLSPYLGIPCTLAIGAFFGLLIGLSVAYVGIPPFIITLGMMTIIRGLAFVITGGYPIYIKSDVMQFLGRGFFLGIPTPVIFMAVVFGLGIFFLGYTRFGRYIYAIGGNINTARLSGIRVGLLSVSVYVVQSALAALSGVLLAGRLASGTPNAGTGFEMDVIAATILGGTSFAGGEGTILGTLIGSLLMGVLTNGLNILNVDSYTQMLIKGFVIVTAVFISVISSRSRGK